MNKFGGKRGQASGCAVRVSNVQYNILTLCVSDVMETLAESLNMGRIRRG